MRLNQLFRVISPLAFIAALVLYSIALLDTAVFYFIEGSGYERAITTAPIRLFENPLILTLASLGVMLLLIGAKRLGK